MQINMCDVPPKVGKQAGKHAFAHARPFCARPCSSGHQFRQAGESAICQTAAALLARFLQGQQRKIAELEAQLAALVARLEESERARQAAEARAAELSAEVRTPGGAGRNPCRSLC